MSQGFRDGLPRELMAQTRWVWGVLSAHRVASVPVIVFGRFMGRWRCVSIGFPMCKQLATEVFTLCSQTVGTLRPKCLCFLCVSSNVGRWGWEGYRPVEVTRFIKQPPLGGSYWASEGRLWMFTTFYAKAWDGFRSGSATPRPLARDVLVGQIRGSCFRSRTYCSVCRAGWFPRTPPMHGPFRC